MKSRKLSDWYVPLDVAVIYGLPFVIIPVSVLFAMLLPLLSRARSSGDTTLLYVAFAVGAVGVILLAFARMPLYRQGRFFTFGPRALDEAHRRLYWWAYRFIVVSVLLMSLLLLFLR
jgi:hypothetical protein